MKKPILVQKLIRGVFGANNVDTCARVCHSPTGYGLKTTFGTSAGTQDFDSRDGCRRDPADRGQSHRWPPGVRFSRMKKRLREGAKLIVVDPRRIDWSAPRISRLHIICRCNPAPMSPC